MSNIIIQASPISAPQDTLSRNMAYGIYFLYILSFFIHTSVIFGIILAHIFRGDAKGILASHYQYLIRTFWLGLIYFVLAIKMTPFLIGLFIFPILFLWWLIRSAKGLRTLMRNEPIQNPTALIF